MSTTTTTSTKVVDEYVDSMTDKERKCVNALRERLRKNYPSLPSIDTSTTLPFKGSQIDTSDYCLLRYTRARKCKVDAAYEMLRQGILFRKRFVPGDTLDPEKYQWHPIMSRFRTYVVGK
jgi:hypothetical protein